MPDAFDEAMAITDGKCKTCGASLPDDGNTAFCPTCGTVM